jgi:hypothetical protein
MLWSRWTPGPESPERDRALDNLFVSVTHFQAFHWHHLPGIALSGLSLQRRWNELPGAIGSWLWVDIGRRASGSVSVWRSEADMRNFVRWKPHIKIVSKYRLAGRMTSTSWIVPRLDRRAIRSEAARWLTQSRVDPLSC